MVSIREARSGDAPRLAEMLCQLGYPTEEEEVGARLERARRVGAVIVAEEGGACVGLAAYQFVYHFEIGAPRCKLTALVVDEATRAKGAGRALVAEVEARAAAGGCTKVELTSSRQATREAAHRFYPSIGYADSGERSVYYIKDLPLR
jgi:GNAT superfamily N-acetyltransferase